MKSLQYEVKAVGLKVGGHPHQLLFSNFEVACGVYEQLCKEHPNFEIHLNQIQAIRLKQREVVQKIPFQCPRGHGGTVDGKMVLRQNMFGNWICSVCGEIWREVGTK